MPTRPSRFGLPVVRQVDRLSLALARQLEERRDMAVVQLAGELQAPINPHPDRLAQELLGAHRRAVLPGLLSCSPDLIKAALDALQASLPHQSARFQP